MAKVFRGNFETRNLDYEVNSVIGVPIIDTTIKKTGVASMRCNAVGSEVSAKMFANLGSATDMFHRAYFYFVSFPASLTKIVQIIDAGGDNTSIRVNSNGTLELWDDNAGTQSGSDSSALELNKWYRIEIACGSTHPGNDVQARIDGVEFANRATAQAGANHRSVEFGIMGAVTADVYIDACGSNTDSGSQDNSWLGEDFTLSKPFQYPTIAVGDGQSRNEAAT